MSVLKQNKTQITCVQFNASGTYPGNSTLLGQGNTCSWGRYSPPRRGGEARQALDFGRSDHPVCAFSVASRLLSVAQPPLLCEEGNASSPTN